MINFTEMINAILIILGLGKSTLVEGQDDDHHDKEVDDDHRCTHRLRKKTVVEEQGMEAMLVKTALRLKLFVTPLRLRSATPSMSRSVSKFTRRDAPQSMNWNARQVRNMF